MARPSSARIGARSAPKNQELCRERLDQLKSERSGGMLPETSTQDTIEVFVARWLAAKAGTVRESTLTRYGQLLRRHVVPTLGKKRLLEVKPDALQRLYSDKVADGLSPRTVHHIHTVLHNALEGCREMGLHRAQRRRSGRPADSARSGNALAIGGGSRPATDQVRGAC